ncbi:MAG: DJ-1/PfpI family protein [Caldisericia bacterium]|nr:DJ-1/PfpI family protein [Caldisericia bacterium]
MILVYEGVYLLDFVGPLEIFHDTVDEEGHSAFEVCLVSPDLNAIKAHTGMSFHADYDLETSPKADILVIPGGNLKLSSENPALAMWIQSQAKHAQIILSVCTGAFILADLGLIDGLQATTWFGATQALQQQYPAIHVLTGERYVDNGQIVTTAGVSAGIDGALYVVQRLLGRAIAEKTAHFIEYDWK